MQQVVVAKISEYLIDLRDKVRVRSSIIKRMYSTKRSDYLGRFPVEISVYQRLDGKLSSTSRPAVNGDET